MTDPGRPAFARMFGALVKGQTVPEDVTYAVPWEELEKKMDVPKHAKNVRGKLNVPRERFRVQKNGEYAWAGKASNPPPKP